MPPPHILFEDSVGDRVLPLIDGPLRQPAASFGYELLSLRDVCGQSLLNARSEVEE